MLRLTATDQSITMTTSATGSVDYISDWTDIVNATAVTTAGSGQGNVTTATTTTIIAAPASGSSRAVKSAMISNRHGTTSNTIQLFKTVGAASYAISKPFVLLAGETVRFSDEGFCFVGNACELEVTSATTSEQLESNATTGVMQIVGPAAGTTRVVTIPDANSTMARSDAPNTFTGNQAFSGKVLVDGTTDATTTTDGSLQTDGGLSVVKKSVFGDTLSAVISTATNTKKLFDGSMTYTATTGYADVLDLTATLNPTATATSQIYAAWIKGISTSAYNNGGSKGIILDVTHSGTAVASVQDGLYVRTYNTSTGTVTTNNAINIESLSNSGGGTVTTNIALSIGNQTAGLSNYAIQTGSGLVRFGDTTDATTTSDGAIALSGGLSVAKNVIVGANLKVIGQSGFNNTAPISKPTVTGSRGGNAALASLLTALANYGLITDSTTA